MRQLFISIIFTCLFFSSSIQAQTENSKLLKQLLDLPSPPPENIVVKDGEEKRQRPKEFYSYKNPPKDDAPIEDLIDYWRNKAKVYSYGNNKPPKLNEKVGLRLLAEIEEKPSELTNYLTNLPKTSVMAEEVKNIFDISQNAEGIDDEWRKEVKKWLKYNSKFYLNELISEAEAARDHKSYNSVIKEKELKALAKIDWESATAILEKLKSDQTNPKSATLAKRLLYEIALRNEDETEIEKYRSELQSIVTNQKATGNERDKALDALIFNKDWNGSDEWFISLFEDKTLLELRWNGNVVAYPLNTIVGKSPDKWIPIVVKLIGNQNRAVHNAAVQSLAQFQNRNARKDALEPLIPWLSNPEWANTESDDRFRLIQSMENLDLPQSIPGLIWVLEYDDSNYSRSYAADSLAKYKSPLAVPALLLALEKEKEEDHRRRIINALLVSGGLSDTERLSALELYVNKISTPEGLKEVNGRDFFEENPLPIQISIGKVIANQQEPSEGLIRLAIERQKVLKKENPTIAMIFSDIMQSWKGRLVDLNLLQQIENGTATSETVVGALARRKELRKNVLSDIYALLGKNALANGVSACLSENEDDLLNVLGSSDDESLISVLACSRLIRAKLPAQEVGDLLNSKNKLLELAAKRYLISEDSLEARNLIFSKYPNELLILGARSSFNPEKQSIKTHALSKLFGSVSSWRSDSLHSNESAYTENDKFEDKLREEIVEDQNLIEIYSVVPNFVLRVYKDKAVITWFQDAARYKQRVITKQELDDLKNSIEESKILYSPPVFGGCHHNCGSFELVHIKRNGGHRFFAYTAFSTYLTYYLKFQQLSQTKGSKTRYYLQDKIDGLEVVLASNKSLKIKTFWKDDDDFRILTEDIEKEELIRKEVTELDKLTDKNEDLDYEEKSQINFQNKAEREYEHFEWREFNNSKLGKIVSEPEQVPFLKNRLSVPSIKDIDNNDTPWQSQIKNYEIRAGNYHKGGLWKTNRSGHFKFLDGLYSSPITTPDDKWIVVSTNDNESWAGTDYIARINLRTNKKYKVNLPEADYFHTIAYVPSHNKVLIRRSRNTYYESKKDNPSPQKPENYLLDVETGKTKLVNGEFRPLEHQKFRRLQSTGKPNEFWAAIPLGNKTEIGRYRTKDFSFKVILTIPQITLNSMDIWVDEKDAKVFFVYNGNYGNNSSLLSLPLPKD